MKNVKKTLQIGAAVIAATAWMGAANAAVIVSKDNTTTVSIPGLTGFATTGAMMDGMRVTATFQNQFSQTLAWADTGAASGGVAGAGWRLTQAGDTFSQPWTFSFTGTDLQLVSLVLDASGPGQVTILDTDNPNQGTPGSAQGNDFTISSGCVGCDGTAVYSNQIAIGANPAVGDIYHTLTVTFTGGTGPRADFQFLQDTDNDVRLNQVPEPSALALVGLALAGVGFMRARRKQA